MRACFRARPHSLRAFRVRDDYHSGGKKKRLCGHRADTRKMGSGRRPSIHRQSQAKFFGGKLNLAQGQCHISAILRDYFPGRAICPFETPSKSQDGQSSAVLKQDTILWQYGEDVRRSSRMDVLILYARAYSASPRTGRSGFSKFYAFGRGGVTSHWGMYRPTRWQALRGLYRAACDSGSR